MESPASPLLSTARKTIDVAFSLAIRISFPRDSIIFPAPREVDPRKGACAFRCDELFNCSSQDWLLEEFRSALGSISSRTTRELIALLRYRQISRHVGQLGKRNIAGLDVTKTLDRRRKEFARENSRFADASIQCSAFSIHSVWASRCCLYFGSWSCSGKLDSVVISKINNNHSKQWPTELFHTSEVCYILSRENRNSWKA